MPAISPGGLVRSAVIGRLSHSATGFNACYIAARQNYPTAPDMVIDFAPSSKNFFACQVSAEQLGKTTPFKYPALCLYSAASANKNVQKFHRFSGPVRLYMKFFLSGQTIASSAAPRESEIWADAVEGAVFETFHNPLPSVQTIWDGPVVYNGDLACQRGNLDLSGANWRMDLTFLGTFEAHLN